MQSFERRPEERTVLVLHPDLFTGPVHVPYLQSIVRNLPLLKFRVLTAMPMHRDHSASFSSEVTFEWRPGRWLDAAEKKLPPLLSRTMGVAFDIARGIQYRRLIRRSRFDILHVHVGLETENLLRAGLKLRARALWVIARWLNDFEWTRRPVLFTDHSIFTRREEFGYPNPLHEADLFVTSAYRNVICVEREGCEFLAAHDRREKRNRRRWYIPNGVNVHRFSYRAPRRHDRIRIGYAGRLFRAGESRTFLPQVARLLPDRAELHLAVASQVGENEIRSRWFPRTNVVVHRNLRNEEMPEFYWSVDVVVNPMLWSALGRTTLEAMSCGRPVAMFDNADRYPVTEACGFLIATDDAVAFVRLVERLAERPEELEAKGRAARKLIEEVFDERIVAEKTGEIYKELIGVGGSTEQLRAQESHGVRGEASRDWSTEFAHL